MVSLKPPWRQKNPIMEKACPAYYKQTAPAKAVEIVKKMKLRSNGKTLQAKFVDNGSSKWVNITTVLFKQNYPLVVAIIYTPKEGEGTKRIRMEKFAYGRKVTLSYKGERYTFPKNAFDFHKIVE